MPPAARRRTMSRIFLAPRQRFARERNLRIERAQREVGLRGEPRERQRHDVLRIARAQRLCARRLQRAAQPAPEIELERGRGRETHVVAHRGNPGGYRNVRWWYLSGRVTRCAPRSISGRNAAPASRRLASASSMRATASRMSALRSSALGDQVDRAPDRRTASTIVAARRPRRARARHRAAPDRSTGQIDSAGAGNPARRRRSRASRSAAARATQASARVLMRRSPRGRRPRRPRTCLRRDSSGRTAARTAWR